MSKKGFHRKVVEMILLGRFNKSHNTKLIVIFSPLDLFGSNHNTDSATVLAN